MADSWKNNDILGVLVVLLLLAGQSGEKNKNGMMDFGQFLPGLPVSGLPFSGLSLPPIPLDSFNRDMHRVVDMMDQMASLGQMAGLSHAAGASRSHIEGAADSVSQAVSSIGIPNISNIPNMQDMPDMGQLMEMAGPFMAMMKGQKK